MVRRRVVVRGEVQGVWFRASAEREAVPRRVSGFARNQRDGSVLLELEGEATDVVVDDRPVLCLDLRVEVDGVAPYDARAWTQVPTAAVRFVRPGARVGVTVDPTAPTTLTVDLSRLSLTPAMAA